MKAFKIRLDTIIGCGLTSLYLLKTGKSNRQPQPSFCGIFMSSIQRSAGSGANITNTPAALLLSLFSAPSTCADSLKRRK